MVIEGLSITMTELRNRRQIFYHRFFIFVMKLMCETKQVLIRGKYYSQIKHLKMSLWVLTM